MGESGFVTPVRLIKDANDLRRFERSRTAARFQSFIQVVPGKNSAFVPTLTLTHLVSRR